MRLSAADGESRAAFAFNPQRNAIVLVAGGKACGRKKLFYEQLIAKADSRFFDHLENLKSAKKG